MSLRRSLRGAWWRPESRSRSTLPNVHIGGVYISEFSPETYVEGAFNRRIDRYSGRLVRTTPTYHVW